MDGNRIEKIEIRRPDLRFPFPPGIVEELTGQIIRKVDRRGKYLLFRMENNSILLNSLGMSGRWTLTGGKVSFTPGTFAHGAVIGTGDGPHDHLVIDFHNGLRATYTDARRFGYIHLIKSGISEDQDRFLRVLGPEPLEPNFDAIKLAQNLRNRGSPIKNTLLDQSVVVGLGNIYVNEVLNLSLIHI